MWWFLFGFIPFRQLALALLVVVGAQFLGVDLIGMALSELSGWFTWNWLDSWTFW